MTSTTTNVPRPENISSLNSDGTRNWFIPPYVIPAVMLVLVTARVLFGG